MTEEKEIKLAILKGVAYDVEKAKECYRFFAGDDQPAPVPSTTPKRGEGLYLIYSDGSVANFTGESDRQDVEYIGVVYAGQSFAVALRDANNGEDVVLLPEEKPGGDRAYYPRECDAMYDFFSGVNTNRLCQDNPDLRSILKEGEAIPALGILNIMAHLKDIINDALEYVGGEPLADKWYWSSTEYHSYNAWSVNFNNGGAYNFYKYYGNAGRAVAAF